MAYRLFTYAAFVALLQSTLSIASDAPHWVDIWTTMPQLTEPANLPPVPFNSTPSIFPNTTLRQTLRLTQPVSTIRLRLSNAFGEDDLSITSVAIALPPNDTLGTPLVDSETVTPVLFDGESSIIIPPGSLGVSDLISLPAGTNTTLAVDIYLADGQTGGAMTSHPGSRTTSYMVFGNEVGVENLNTTNSEGANVDHWYFIATIEAPLPLPYKGCALLGDSITDGRGSDTNENDRWPDRLLPILHSNPATKPISLLNQAAGGNRILHDSLGPSLLSRIDRDVLSHSNIHYALIFSGVNDIGTASTSPADQALTARRLIRAYRQIITRLHAADIAVFGATITPFGTLPNATYVQPYSDPERERTRQVVNDWIRTGGAFDQVVDFDAIARDPADPACLLPRFDSGDHLHLNAEGYEALARGVPVGIFEVDYFGV
ncbi:SGNH hydrolase [Aspergillus ellipticus CBS 707.79]|uniref:SGNH hydrolase n=1 Tax=Aspergillus ellipticus CBS 707.79 TaxID=1448320 RepID=A0A319CU02_9EURO|nr:SGNH hydrolase [Aspergillus ellipticus CBS 707.79]